MTYLEAVNEVLALMRLDPVTTVQSPDDEAVKVVTKFVNAAKRKVEDAWRWNALRKTWIPTFTAGTGTAALNDTRNQAIIDVVRYEPKKQTLTQIGNNDMLRKGEGSGHPIHWCINGVDSSNQVQMTVWPTPEVDTVIAVYGWGNEADLVLDDDEIKVPTTPVIYEALAMAARERGEVGGQTALEIFGMAKSYLGDAIALDAALGGAETDWVVS